MSRFARALSGAVLSGAALYSFGSSFFFIVEPGTAVVKWDRFSGGVQDKVFKEGFHWMVPIVQQRFVYETRSRFVLVRTTTGTKDLQDVNITLRILFRPDEKRLPWIHRVRGTNYDQVALPSISNEILKSVVAQFNAEEIITKREVVSGRIRQLMSSTAYDRDGIILDDISLVDTSFTEKFARAVEQKQVAQQEAERHKFIVLRNEHLRDAAITRAEGEANAAKMINDALRAHGPGFLEIRRLETAVAAAKELSTSPHVTFVPKGLTGLFPLRGAA